VSKLKGGSHRVLRRLRRLGLAATKPSLPKGVAGDLSMWLETLRDTLALVTLPMPDKNVGVGAYWMVTSREGVLGLDMVTYRLVKLEDVKDGVATLSVNTKRYSASRSLTCPDCPRIPARHQ